MQNKPNLLDTQMNVCPLLTEYYENLRLCERKENKPNQTQFLSAEALAKADLGLVNWC
jgi:hypothetical protein